MLSEADTYCNRKLAYQLHSEYCNGNGKQNIYLKNFPVDLISDIKKYDGETNSYLTIFDLTDTVSNTTLFESKSGYLWMVKDFYFEDGIKNYKIDYYAGYKSTQTSKTILTITAGTTQATIGITTHGYSNGDVIEFSGVTGFQNNPIGKFIISDVATSTFKINFVCGTGTFSSGTAIADTSLENTIPFDLKNILFELVSYIAKDFGIVGNARLGLTSENWNAAGTGAKAFATVKERDEYFMKRFLPYRKINM